MVGGIEGVAGLVDLIADGSVVSRRRSGICGLEENIFILHKFIYNPSISS